MMAQSELAGEYRERSFSAGGRTVVVGVKLDSQSRELLTWALVKVAQTGDRVIALYVLNTNEILDREGQSSLLSLVKAFDSVLAVYEGFCNLKQVDLKLKICRGTSIRKILVREAKSYGANEVIVGTARTHHTMKSSASVAKYCARKLPKDCSIIAVNNGKIVFHRDSPSPSLSNVGGKGSVDRHHRNRLFSAIQRSLSLNPKVLIDTNEEKSSCKNWELALVKADSCCTITSPKEKCSICSPDSVLPSNSCAQLSLEYYSSEDGLDDQYQEKSLAIVPSEKQQQGVAELRPGWPLLRRALSSKRLSAEKSPVRQISVVQWAMKLPTRHCWKITTGSDVSHKIDVCNGDDDERQVNADNGAIVPVGDDTLSVSSSMGLQPKSLPKELAGLHEKYSATCRLFKYEELVSATFNFKHENMIGKGGSSKVYRGCLPDGKELAVKILKSSEDVIQEFVLEIEIITTIHHQNIISLFGFCFEDNNLLLVYDFLSRGSLEDNLHGTKKDLAFGWNERCKVALGVAEALSYLHNSAQPVIHRDVKSSNILLSDDFEPQLSDFGLAKWASTTSTHITCADVAGTFGYLAPEYFMYGKVNEKIDVYAFGVVLLELLSGRKPISNEKGQESLVMWAKPFLNGGKFSRLVDPSLGDKYDAAQMERIALAATLCIRRAPRARPQISTVLKLLQGDEEVTKWARLELDSSGGSDARLLQINNLLGGADVLEDDGFSQSNLRSHLNLALLDVDDSSLSMSSIEESVSLEDYLRGRWSRSSSFD